MTPRLALCAVAFTTAALSYRRPALRPLAASLLTVATLDCARLVTLPRALAGVPVWMRADAAILAWWPAPVAALLTRRYRIPVVAALSAFALLVALTHWQRWGLSALYLPALRLPRFAVAALALLTHREARRDIGGRVGLLLTAGMLAGVCVDTWADWTGAQAYLSTGVWLAAGAFVVHFAAWGKPSSRA